MVRIQMFEWLLDLELDEFRAYVSTINQMLVDSRIDLSRKFRDEAKGLAEQDAELAREWYDNQASSLESVFPTICNNATFNAIYAFLEHELFLVCDRLKLDREFGIGVNDLAGQGIDKCQKYLVKVAGIDFPSDSDEWKKIKHLKVVRNLIAHNRGYVGPEWGRSDRYLEVRKFLEGCSNETLENDRIVLSKEFCLETIETIRKFMKKVLAEIPEL